ncbi:tRNA lysidine(34) synthetase TilS, partial [bacterium]|nr:tRNA lysidine(34) synthetase TilS [candidate division CSSED10-310 bacterium]
MLVAVSGGPDSVAMLRVLHAVRDTLHCELHVAHLHHGLRGVRADADLAFVQALAGRLRLSFLHERLADAGSPESQLESRLRNRRYAFLRMAAERFNATRIATGHTADDQVETILMRLVRGAAPRALQGIRTRRGMIVRPLLEISREEVLEYLAELHQEFRDDHTNRDLRFLRNRVRHCIVPHLKRLNPSLHHAMTNYTRLMAMDDAFLARELEASAPIPDSTGKVPADTLRLLPDALRWRWLEAFLTETTGESIRLAHVAAVDALLSGRAGAGAVPIPGGWRAVRRYDHFSVERPVPSVATDLELTVPGCMAVPLLGLRVTVRVTASLEGGS